MDCFPCNFVSSGSRAMILQLPLSHCRYFVFWYFYLFFFIYNTLEVTLLSTTLRLCSAGTYSWQQHNHPLPTSGTDPQLFLILKTDGRLRASPRIPPSRSLARARTQSALRSMTERRIVAAISPTSTGRDSPPSRKEKYVR